MANAASKANGEVRLNLYRTIINSYAHKIEEVLNNVGKTYDDFAGIKSLLKEVKTVSQSVLKNSVVKGSVGVEILNCIGDSTKRGQNKKNIMKGKNNDRKTG